MDTPILKILLIDDDETAFILIRRLLQKVSDKKFNVEWAQSFEAGLTAIANRRHDLYLLDYYLGFENGLDLLRKAISLKTPAPIIVLTGIDDPKIDRAAAEIGAADFLLKDKLDTATLERSIRYSLQHFATLNALQRSNERFRLLFERSLDAILISDDHGQFVEANSSACHLLGYLRAQLLGLKISDLFAPDPQLLIEWRQSGFGELTFTRPDGERRVVEFSASHFAPNLNLSILRDITERRILEKEIQEISEREQRRLGQDLHDGLGQALTGISFLAKVLEKNLTAKKVDEAKEAGEIAALLNEALAQTRRLSRGLCPVVLETNDIEAALEQLVENLKCFFGADAEFKCDPEIKIADNEVAVHLYRIAQEATTNAIKHGKARMILITLFSTSTRLILRVKDDGLGFAKDALNQKGMGLRVMQHRARMMGGFLSVRKLRQGGTLVTCSLKKNLTFGKNGHLNGSTISRGEAVNAAFNSRMTLVT